ncbi:helix-turn-helix transcriptional regulator [Natronococcus amylolyticus]|nr:transcriptional regulator [Natronococcus amylolyticus]
MSTTTGVDGMCFLTQSSVRIRLLETLYDEQRLRKRELRGRFDASRVTVRRNVAALEERDLVAVTGRTCEITPLGELVVEDVLPALSLVDVVERLRPFVRWFPDDELEFDLRALEDATVIAASSSDPYAPVNRHIEAMEHADRFRCLLPAVGLPAMTVARDRVVDGGSEHELIYGREIAVTVRSQPEYERLIDEMLESRNCELYVADRGLEFYLGLFEDGVQLGVENDDGVPRALVETDAEEVREWAERTYDRYRTRADPLMP